MNVWRAAAKLARDGAGGALATVARTVGSTPVPAGTKLLVGPEGRLEGTVGGGCVEADVLAAAMALSEPRPIVLTHHLNADLAGDLGLSCGGTVDIVVEPLVGVERYVRALDAAAVAEEGVVTTGLDWSAGPQKRFTPAGDAQGPAAELSADRSALVERIRRPPRVVVFGAGHVGRAIARAADLAGFRVVLIDDRPEFADPKRFPDRLDVRAAGVVDALAAVPLLASDAIVIATRGHRHDAVILERVGRGLCGAARESTQESRDHQGVTDGRRPRDGLGTGAVPRGCRHRGRNAGGDRGQCCRGPDPLASRAGLAHEP
jgi:xanthine dehydrogenase accessory factor